MTTSPQPAAQIELVRLERQTVVVPIVGITPYIPHRFPEKARRQMREKQTSASRVKAAREPKDPAQEAFDSTYWIVPHQVLGAPAAGFALAMNGAVRSFDGITMVQAKTLFRVRGEGPEQLVRLLDTAWEMHEDTPRNANGQPDLRYRNYVFPWRAEVAIDFKSQLISAQSIIALLEEAGTGGIGDWRPSAKAGGIFGQWELDDAREVQVL